MATKEDLKKFIEIAKQQYDDYSHYPVAQWRSFIHTYNAYKRFCEDEGIKEEVEF